MVAIQLILINIVRIFAFPAVVFFIKQIALFVDFADMSPESKRLF